MYVFRFEASEIETLDTPKDWPVLSVSWPWSSGMNKKLPSLQLKHKPKLKPNPKPETRWEGRSVLQVLSIRLLVFDCISDSEHKKEMFIMLEERLATI